jgi:hypothetical protein
VLEGSMKHPVAEGLHRSLVTVYQVSSYLDFPFTLSEVADFFLPGADISANELRQRILSGDFGDIPFKIESNCLLTRPNQSLRIRLIREATSTQKLLSAAKFASALTKLIPWVVTIAVTGSVAYGSAGKRDDIDLFIITKRNRLWLSIFFALVLVRVFKTLRLQPAHLLPFCMSYVHDEHGFRNEARRSVNPLFARELLKAVPLVGKDHYRRLLEENDWVQSMHPSSYLAKLNSLPSSDGQKDPMREIPIVFDWGDGFAFFLLSRYLRLRAYLTNLKLKSHGQQMRLFDPLISRNSCVYTSNFYRWLRQLWQESQ